LTIHQYKELAVVGGGSWGTALAVLLAPRFEHVRLWVYEADLAARMASTRVNDVFLPDCRLPENIEVSTHFEEVLRGAQIVLGVMPSAHARRTYGAMLPFLDPAMLFVSATKGIENGTLLRMTEVANQVLSALFTPRVAALSGPTFAREVVRGEPAAVAIASEDMDLTRDIQAAFSGPSFRLYTNDDVIGVELGAALKNVIAIGAGVCHGLGLGNNTMAALITRGLAEITRLAVSMGGRSKTLAGLAGLGDLVLTCTGGLSRNRQVGVDLAKGRKIDEILAGMRMVAEGVETTTAAVGLARLHGVEMPITEQMYAIIKLGRPPQEAIRELMVRSLKGE
jgi:glycerol-3-phosphate dehydrogenase (NAD(P)+)